MKNSKLRKMLKASGLRPVEVAARRKVDRCVVSRQVRDGIKTTRLAREYAAILNCNPLELLDCEIESKGA